VLGARNATWNVRYFEISLEVIFWLKVRQKEQEFASRSPLPPETQTVYSIGFNMGRQLDELSVFFFWRPAIYVTSLCYCYILRES